VRDDEPPRRADPRGPLLEREARAERLVDADDRRARPALRLLGHGYAVTSTRSPLGASPGELQRTTSSSPTASRVIVAPSSMSPASRARPMRVSTSCWAKRRSGRAP